MEAALEAASKPLAKEQHLNQQSHHHHQENSHCGSCRRADLLLPCSRFISFWLTFIICTWVTDVWPGQVKRGCTRQVSSDTVIIINTSGILVCFSGWPHNCARSDHVMHWTLPGQSRVEKVRTHLHSSAGSRFADSRPGYTVFLSHNPCLHGTRCYRWLMTGNMWLKALLLQSQNKYFKCLYNIQKWSIPWKYI